MKYQLSAVALLSAVVLTGCGNEPLTGEYQCYKNGNPFYVMGFSSPNKATLYSTVYAHVNHNKVYALSSETEYEQSGSEINFNIKNTGNTKVIWKVSPDRKTISNQTLGIECRKEVVAPNVYATQDDIDRRNNPNGFGYSSGLAPAAAPAAPAAEPASGPYTGPAPAHR